MSKFLIILLIISFGLVLAAEYPVTESQTPVNIINSNYNEQVKTKKPIEYTYKPFWSVLEVLTSEERTNAKIHIILDVTESNEANEYAKYIESLWNNNQYDEALVKFSKLEKMINPMGATVGISWRKPIPSPELRDNPYVQIGNRDSIYVVAYDVDYSNSNYLCVLLLEGDRTAGGGSRYSVNISTNGGTNWSETHCISGFSYKMNDIGGEVSGRHFWVGYTGGSSNRTLWLTHYLTSTGQIDTFSNGNYSYAVYTAPSTDAIRELEVASNQTYLSNRVYLFCMMDSDSLRLFWDDTNGVSWTAAHPPYANAKNGLDACWNEGFMLSDTTGRFMSYIGTNDTVNILRHTSGNWRVYFKYYMGPCSEQAEKTTIGAYRDTVCCAFLLQGVRVRYLIKYGPNPIWYYGDVPQDTSPGLANYTADLTCRGNKIHLVYRAPGNQGVYTYRHYYQYAPWSTPQRYDESRYVHAWIRPEIQWIGSGDDVGIVWASYPPGLQKAYFTKTPLIDITENSAITINQSRLKSHLVPGGVNIQYNLTNPGPVTIKVFDITGKLITTQNEIKQAGIHNWFWSAKTSGIYFAKVNANDETGTLKIVLTK